MKEDILMNETDLLCEKLGLEDELKELSKSFIANFAISGEITEVLEEVLKRAPDSLIDLIWDSIEDEEPNLLNREEKEKQLCEDIPQDLKDEVIYLNEYQLMLLYKIKTAKSVETFDISNIYEMFCSRGWIFSFSDTEDKNCSFVMVEQISKILEGLHEDEKTLKMMDIVMNIRLVIQTALNLYGVVEREQLMQLLTQYMVRDGIDLSRIDFFYELCNQALVDLEGRDGEFWLDHNYVISNEFEDVGDYKRFLKNCKNQEYYIPTNEEIYLYCESVIDSQNIHYKSFAHTLKRLVGSDGRGDNLMYQIEFQVVEENMNSGGLLDILLYHDISFKNKETAEDFFRCFNDWAYEVKHWKNRGYSDKELGYRKNDFIPNLSLVVKERLNNAIKIKIGRNDLCPCGSGKKYKKCCMGKT